MNYWETREIRERLRLAELTEKSLLALIRGFYEDISEDLLARIRQLYLEIKTSKTPTADQLYRNDKYYKLLNEINVQLEAMARYEEQTLRDGFEKYYRENYIATGKVGDKPLLDNTKIRNAVMANWVGDGRNFSDRIWLHKRELIAKLEQELVNIATTGKNWGESVKEIRADFGVSFNQARTLVRTELQHIQNLSCLDKYRADGVKKVIFLTAKDCRTCMDCGERNEKEYEIDQAPIIPIHPNCRCTYIAKVELPKITIKGENLTIAENTKS